MRDAGTESVKPSPAKPSTSGGTDEGLSQQILRKEDEEVGGLFQAFSRVSGTDLGADCVVFYSGLSKKEQSISQPEMHLNLQELIITQLVPHGTQLGWDGFRDGGTVRGLGRFVVLLTTRFRSWRFKVSDFFPRNLSLARACSPEVTKKYQE